MIASYMVERIGCNVLYCGESIENHKSFITGEMSKLIEQIKRKVCSQLALYYREAYFRNFRWVTYYFY